MTDPDTPAPAGADLARQALNLARAEARRRGATPTRRPQQRRGRAPRGAGRDPQALGTVIDQLADQFGWKRPSAGAQIVIAWPEIAGDAARLAAAERYDADTRTLHLRPVSAAAATQLRLTARRIAADLNARTGAQTVDTVHVLPPGRSPALEQPPPPTPATAADASGARSAGADGGRPRRRDAPPGLLQAQAQALLASLRTPAAATSGAARARADAPALREPLDAFTDAVAMQEDLAEQADRSADVLARARARARAEKAGQAPAVPRAFDQTA